MKTETSAINSHRTQFSVHWTFLLVVIWLIIVNVFSSASENGWVWSLIMVLSMILSLFIHDISQALMAALFRIRIKKLTFLPIGALPAISKKPKKVWQEILMLMAGPAANLLIAAILLVYLKPYSAYWDEPQNIGVGYGGNFLFQLQFINLSIGLLNLLPAFPMDGGRILDAILEKIYDEENAVKIVNTLSMLIAAGFAISGVIYMNYAILLIGLFIFFTVPLGKYYHPLKKKIVKRMPLDTK
ncbi:MAG TPA: site-2 protease family protein [Puia sp.]|nr:site-2 protease family protein [Puia sp.]